MLSLEDLHRLPTPEVDARLRRRLEQDRQDQGPLALVHARFVAEHRPTSPEPGPSRRCTVCGGPWPCGVLFGVLTYD